MIKPTTLTLAQKGDIDAIWHGITPITLTLQGGHTHMQYIYQYIFACIYKPLAPLQEGIVHYYSIQLISYRDRPNFLTITGLS